MDVVKISRWFTLFALVTVASAAPGDTPFASGRDKLKSGDTSGALEDFDQAIALNTDFANAYYHRGAARFQEGDLRGAIEDYSKVIELSGESKEVFHDRAVVRHVDGDLKGAIADYTAAINLDPEWADAYYGRAVSRQDDQDRDGALLDYDRTIELHPGDLQAYATRSALKRMSGDTDGFLRDKAMARFLEAGLTVEQVGVDVLEERVVTATISIDNRNWAKFKVWDDDLDDLPNFFRRATVESPIVRGLLELNQGDFEAAAKEFALGIAAQRINPLAYLLRGLAKRLNGDTKAAISDFETALSLAPKDSDALFHRGWVYFVMGKFRPALKDFRNRLLFHPNFEDEARTRLAIWLCQAQLKERAVANTELAAYLQTCNSGDAEEWTTTIGRNLIGDATEKELLARAVRFPLHAQSRTCEAYFYIGIKHLFDDEKALARENFEKALATKSFVTTEYFSAQNTLKSLSVKR